MRNGSNRERANRRRATGRERSVGRRAGGLGIVLAAMIVAVGLVAPVAALAQEEPGASGGESATAEAKNAEDEKPASETRPPAAQETSIHGGKLVIAAYLLLWISIVIYIVYLGTRQKRLARQIEGLESRIDETLAGIEEE